MRLWLISIVIGSFLLSGSTGCKSLQQKFGSSKKESAPGTILGKRKSPTQELDPDDVLDPLGARNSNRLLLDDLAPSQFSTTMKVRLQGGSDQQAAQQAYAEGQRLYNAGIGQLDAKPDGDAHQQYFEDAANQFRLASASWPDSQIEEDALYFEGESFFFSDRYVQSNRSFEKLVANYSGTHYLDLAEQRRYAIAVYWLQLAEKSGMPNLTDPKRPKTGLAGEARRVLHRIRIDDPTGKLADDATLALGKAFMQAKRYYEAADTFEDLRRKYPGSKHQFTAHMLELEARLNGYQGKDYDDTPLRKADDLMKTIVRQFPQESRTQLTYLEKQASQIQNQIAERDYTMAQYFEGRGENRAAKIYYEKVAQKFQDTELGKTVEQQITKVAAKPPKPEQHAKWLVDIFPNPEAERPVIQAGNNETIFR
jgi:outer membrane protein assembly factor BamD (BamD/ComL family)